MFVTYIGRIKDVLGNTVIVNILIELLRTDNIGTTLFVLLDILEGYEGIMLASIVVNIHLLVAATWIIFLICLPRDVLLFEQINNRVTVNIGFIVFLGSFGRATNESDL